MLNAAIKTGAVGHRAVRPFLFWLPLPYLLLLACCYSVFTVTADDPFITYRYAMNLLAGHGPVYNIGERVEGYSSPFHLLLCALLLKIAPSVEILFKAKLLGIIFAFIAVYQTRRLGRLAGLRPWECLLAQALVAANINFALAAVNGLETTLYVCVVAAAVEAFLRECRGRGGVRSAVWLWVALLTRPETLVLFTAFLLVRIVWVRRRRLPLRSVAGWVLLFVWLAGMTTLARLAYYGEPLPNTYYAKHVLTAIGLSQGSWYLAHPLSPMVLDLRDLWRVHAASGVRLMAFGTLVFWGLAVVGACLRWRRTSGQISITLVTALAIFVLRSGGDWMAGWRFLASGLPLFAILQCHGLRLLARWLVSRQRPLASIPALAALSLWVSCAAAAPHVTWREARFSTHSEDLLVASSPLGRKWVATARYIQRNVTPGVTVAYSEMGYAGCLNLDKKFIDVRGLTDREIARLPDEYKGAFGVDDEQWFFPGDPLYQILIARRPDTIIAFSHQYEPTLVLGRYVLAAVVQDPRDPPAVIVPSLVYVSAGETP